MADEDQKAEAERIRAGVKHDDSTYMKRLSDDMSVIRKDLQEVISYIRKAERYVPEDFRRYAMTFHDVYHIRNAYAELGVAVPPHLDRAIELLADRFKHVVDDLEKEGGAFHKTRKEVVKRGDYRYDHNTPLLTAEKLKQEKEDEAGKSNA